MKTTLAESNLLSYPLQTALSLLSKEKMRETLSELCLDKYRGRRTGTPSHDLVTDWIAKRFLDLGLGMRTNSFYTEDEVLDLYSRASLGELNDKGKVIREFEHRVEFAEHPRSKELRHFSEGVVAVWSEQTDSSNKWLIFDSRNGPDLDQFSRVVARLGASGVIISQSADKRGFFWKQLPAPSVVDAPVLFVRADIIPHLVGKKLRAILPLRRNRVRGVNVIGELSGSDSSLKNSPLIVSAHYDAVGDDPLGHRFQGAGDNAAGVAVILELARILASSKVIPRRTLQFVAFDGEEVNASGSRAYAKFMQENSMNPLVLNLDGAGVYRGTVSVEAGGKNPKDLIDALDFAGEKLEIPLAMGNIASDNRRFVALGFSSAGVALGIRALHTPADNVETVDPDAMKKAAELFLMTIWKLAYDLN